MNRLCRGAATPGARRHCQVWQRQGQGSRAQTHPGRHHRQEASGGRQRARDPARAGTSQVTCSTHSPSRRKLQVACCTHSPSVICRCRDHEVPCTGFLSVTVILLSITQTSVTAISRRHGHKMPCRGFSSVTWTPLPCHKSQAMLQGHHLAVYPSAGMCWPSCTGSCLHLPLFAPWFFFHSLLFGAGASQAAAVQDAGRPGETRPAQADLNACFAVY